MSRSRVLVPGVLPIDAGHFALALEHLDRPVGGISAQQGEGAYAGPFVVGAEHHAATARAILASGEQKPVDHGEYLAGRSAVHFDSGQRVIVFCAGRAA